MTRDHARWGAEDCYPTRWMSQAASEDVALRRHIMTKHVTVIDAEMRTGRARIGPPALRSARSELRLTTPHGRRGAIDHGSFRAVIEKGEMARRVDRVITMLIEVEYPLPLPGGGGRGSKGVTSGRSKDKRKVATEGSD